eukprot:gene32464-42056_t
MDYLEELFFKAVRAGCGADLSFLISCGVAVDATIGEKLASVFATDLDAERRVASDLEAAEKRTIALREDAAVVKPEWVGNLVFSRAKYLSPVGQFIVVSSTQKDDVTITIIKNEIENHFVRIETGKGGHGDGKEGTQGQGMSTTMAGNYFFVFVDRKMFATDDSVYQANQPNMRRNPIVVGKLSRRLVPERPTYTPGRQGAGVRGNHRGRSGDWIETFPRLCGHAIVVIVRIIQYRGDTTSNIEARDNVTHSSAQLTSSIGNYSIDQDPSLQPLMQSSSQLFSRARSHYLSFTKALNRLETTICDATNLATNSSRQRSVHTAIATILSSIKSTTSIAQSRPIRQAGISSPPIFMPKPSSQPSLPSPPAQSLDQL